MEVQIYFFALVVNNTSPRTTLNTKWPSEILWKRLSRTFPQDSVFVARIDLYKNFIKYTNTLTVLGSFRVRHEDKSNDFRLSQTTVTHTIVRCIFMIFPVMYDEIEKRSLKRFYRYCWSGFPFVYWVPILISPHKYAFKRFCNFHFILLTLTIWPPNKSANLNMFVKLQEESMGRSWRKAWHPPKDTHFCATSPVD